jgi:putative tricarboxylic transport membrane protein
VLLALAVAVLGGFVIYETLIGPGNPGYAEVGPRAFPILIGFGLTLAGVALLVQALRGAWQVVWIERSPAAAIDARIAANSDYSREGSAAAPLRNVLLVAAALVLDVVLMAPLGFIVASAVMFAMVAAAFDSRRHLLNAALGLAFGGAIHLVFVRGLGLHLPLGSIWVSLPWIS